MGPGQGVGELHGCPKHLPSGRDEWSAGPFREIGRREVSGSPGRAEQPGRSTRQWRPVLFHQIAGRGQRLAEVVPGLLGRTARDGRDHQTGTARDRTGPDLVIELASLAADRRRLPGQYVEDFIAGSGNRLDREIQTQQPPYPIALLDQAPLFRFAMLEEIGRTEPQQGLVVRERWVNRTVNPMIRVRMTVGDGPQGQDDIRIGERG